MAFTIEIDASGIESALERLVPEMDAALHTAMLNATNEVANEAKQRAPIDEGTLRTSIQAMPVQGSFSGGSLEGGVTATAPYAMHVEYGTGLWGPTGSRIFPKRKKALANRLGNITLWGPFKSTKGMPPQPFMGPAWEAKRDRVIDEFRAAVRKAINAAGKG